MPVSHSGGDVAYVHYSQGERSVANVPVSHSECGLAMCLFVTVKEVWLCSCQQEKERWPMCLSVREKEA